MLFIEGSRGCGRQYCLSLTPAAASTVLTNDHTGRNMMEVNSFVGHSLHDSVIKCNSIHGQLAFCSPNIFLCSYGQELTLAMKADSRAGRGTHILNYCSRLIGTLGIAFSYSRSIRITPLKTCMIN